MTYTANSDNGYNEQASITVPDLLIDEIARHPLFSQLYITDMFFSPTGTAENVISPDRFADNALIYCVNGSGYLRTGTAEYNIAAGYFTIMPKGVSYLAGSTQGWSVYIVHFTGALSDTIISELGIIAGKPSPIDFNICQITSIFHEIIILLQMEFTLQSVSYASMKLWNILGSLLFRDLVFANGNQTDPIADSIEYMNKNLHKDLTLEEVAAVAGYSPSHFTAIFKERTGTAPITYFINLKMHLASQYLLQTNKTIKEISYILGYSSQYYFSRLFKTHIGFSPSQYRSNE